MYGFITILMIYFEAANRRRTDNAMAKRKRTKGQTAIYKTSHIKLNIE
jgi:hypothetical protein